MSKRFMFDISEFDSYPAMVMSLPKGEMDKVAESSNGILISFIIFIMIFWLKEHSCTNRSQRDTAYQQFLIMTLVVIAIVNSFDVR